MLERIQALVYGRSKQSQNKLTLIFSEYDAADGPITSPEGNWIILASDAELEAMKKMASVPESHRGHSVLGFRSGLDGQSPDAVSAILAAIKVGITDAHRMAESFALRSLIPNLNDKSAPGIKSLTSADQLEGTIQSSIRPINWVDGIGQRMLEILSTNWAA